MLTHDEIIEIGKAMSELFKLVTTLDTAMVGIVVTIVEKVFTTERVFKSKYNLLFLAVSLFSFIISLGISLWALVTIPYNVVDMLQEGTSVMWVGRGSFFGALLSFIIGIIFFVLLSGASILSNPSFKTQQTVEQYIDAQNNAEEIML